MTTRISKIFRRKEAGFLLTEVLIVLIIVSIVAIGASTMVVQLINVKSTNANNVTVTTNINSATDSLVPDLQMCNIVITEEDGNDVITGIGQAEGGGETNWNRAPGSETGIYIFTSIGAKDGETKWLCLDWEWEDTLKKPEYHQVTYEILDGRLYRIHKIYSGKYDSEGKLINKYENKTSETSTMIAQYIDEGTTNWKLIYDEETNDATVEITISASTGGYKSASEGRTIQVSPRTV